MGRLQDKVAVITGGTSGIGKATAELFIEEGARVVVGDISDDIGARMAADFGDNFAFIHCDVSKENEIKAMVDLAVSKFGRLDCLFNNAGMGGEGGSINDMTVEGFHSTVDVLLLGVMLGIKYAAPIMAAQNSGSIINTASIAGVGSGYGPHIYSAAKAAVRHVSVTTASELAKHNIRVNAICPGGIATAIFARGLNLPSQLMETMAEAVKSGLENWQPIPRVGLPRDIAEAALYLASDGSSFVTGQSLIVDGGATLGQPYPNFEDNLGVFGGIMESMVKKLEELGIELPETE
ncbi:MAG: glucose 1-dehydrogenase [Alphaproteobacteria bacterium]|nr:MAG: glucose 1-dehydrogenase [Alphaproteobacteria bacterium]